ncbi:MAG TPA: MMPL family transporter [Gemmobacter sp.]|nr:MMPL family transporter [Gemmobacter sp.]
MKLLTALDTGVTRLLTVAFTHRLKTLLVVMALIFVYVASNLPTIQKDGRIEAFMHPQDPALLSYYAMRREFGQDNRLVIAVAAPDIFDRDFLSRFSQLHNEISDGVPYISEIFSPYNIPFIQYENGGVYLEELVRNLLLRGRDPAELRERILDTPLYKNFVVSSDGKTAAIVIEPYRYAPAASDCIPDPNKGHVCVPEIVPTEQRRLLGAPEYAQMEAAAATIIARYQADGFDVHMAGAPVVSTEIVRMMDRDMPRFTLACVIITLITMFAMTRSVIVSFGALLTFFTSIFTTLATVAVTGTAMTPPTQLLIPMTLVVGLCSYIHFISALLKARSESGDARMAVALAVRRCNRPIFFAALTTAGGLAGLIASPLAPISDLGLFGLVSVSVSYVLALFWATMAFRFLPRRYFERRSAEPGRIARGMQHLAAASAAAPLTALAISLLVTAGIAIGILRLDYSHNSLLWLPKDNSARLSTEFIDSHYHGSVNLELVITPKNGLDFRDAGLLQTVEQTAQNVPGMVDIPIGRHTSMISFLEETNQAIHDGDVSHRKLPEQEKIWDQILLLEGQGNDDMKRYVSLDYDTGRVSFQTPWLEAKLYTDVIATIETAFRDALGEKADVQATGLIALLAQTSTAVLESVTQSYLLSLVIVTLCMMVALRSFGWGAVSMVPNILPFVVLLGVMGFAAIPLDTFTILIGGIITGIIVDDTLHLFHTVRHKTDEGEDVVSAMRSTFAEVGDAVAITTLVVMASFAVFMLSEMANIRTFGMLMVMGSALALVTDVTVGPAVIALYRRKRERAAQRSLQVADAAA